MKLTSVPARRLAPLAVVALAVLGPSGVLAEVPARRTTLSIEGESFRINGRPTYEGRTWNGRRIEGLLMNSRMVQATFDDRNPETVALWAYPDTGRRDPERNTREFVAAMPEWRQHGLLAFTVNLQGGSPQGYNFVAAVEEEYASWGDFDYRLEGQPFEAGYQSVPVDWTISHPRKRGSFDTVREITGTVQD